LKWSDRDGFALGVVSELGTKVQEVRDAEEGLGRANLHPGLGGIIFMNPLRSSVEVSVHDLDVGLDWQNVTYEGKAPEVVPGLSNGSDGSPMSAKVGVQRSNHRLIRPVGGWRSDDHNLLARGAVGGGLFTTGLRPVRIGGGQRWQYWTQPVGRERWRQWGRTGKTWPSGQALPGQRRRPSSFWGERAGGGQQRQMPLLRMTERQTVRGACKSVRKGPS
jgi:hypothetical protein